MTMIVCMETSAASWLLDSQVPWQQLVNLGPAGFPAYARLRFLPDPRWPGQKEAEAVARPDTPSEGDQLRAALAVLSRHTSTPKQCYFCLWDGYGLHAPSQVVDGRQPSRQQAEVEPLPREAHSSVAPETAQPGLRPLSMQPERPTHSAATVRIPHRDYYLFQGAWSDLGDWERRRTRPGLTIGCRRRRSSGPPTTRDALPTTSTRTMPASAPTP